MRYGDLPDFDDSDRDGSLIGEWDCHSFDIAMDTVAILLLGQGFLSSTASQCMLGTSLRRQRFIYLCWVPLLPFKQPADGCGFLSGFLPVWFPLTILRALVVKVS